MVHGKVKSPPTANPWQRLAGAIVVQAFRDFKGKDPIAALDAYDFLTDGAALALLDELGFQVDPDDIFIKAVDFATS